MTLSAFAQGVGSLYLNFYFRSLGLGDTAIGALNAAPAIGLVAAAVPTFAFADRFPRKYVLLFGGSLTLLATLGVIASSTLPALLLFAAFFGSGLVVTEAAGFALLAEATSDESRPRIFGVSFFSAGVAFFVANVGGGALAGPVASWLGRPEHDPQVLRSLLAIAAAVGATSAIPVLLLSSRGHARHVDVPRSWGRLARFAFVNACFGFGAGSFLPFVNLFFNERFGFGFAAVGLALGLVNVAGGLGGLLHTRVSPRLGSVRSLTAFWTASLPFALVGAFAPSGVIAILALLGRGVLMTAAVPTMDAFTISAFAAAERSAAQALVTTTWSLASGAGALVSGAVRAALGPDGFTLNLLTLVGCYIVAIAFFAFSFGRR